MRDKWTGTLIGRMHNEKITYQDLAEEMNVTKAYISMVLNGSRKPKGIEKRLKEAFNSVVEKRKDTQKN